jgi:hypothetical protein
MGVPPYVVQHLRGAMADYQTGHMSGADNNVEKLTGRRSMTVGEFARAHADVLNAKPAAGYSNPMTLLAGEVALWCSMTIQSPSIPETQPNDRAVWRSLHWVLSDALTELRAAALSMHPRICAPANESLKESLTGRESCLLLGRGS